MSGGATAQARLTNTKRLVVKVGSALLVDAETGQADAAWLARLAQDCAALKHRGAQVLIVSSGAVALGRRRLGLPLRGGLELAEKQAAAAAGQSLLMRAWESAFEPHRIACAQVLLTPDDTEIRRRWLNGRSTLDTLIKLGAVPVINENDTVATAEIRYGDNDRLAARAAQMIGADLLVLLSDIDGLYTADPRRDPGARHLPLIQALTPEIEAMAGGVNAEAGVGSGGMASKLAAARIADAAGCATVIANGHPPAAKGAFGPLGPLQAVAEGARATLIEARANPIAAYKQWIAGSLAPKGELIVDPGCAKALRQGRSLLPAGVKKVLGAFGRGDAVVVRGLDGVEIARGLIAYDAEAAMAIAGRKSDAIEAVLGWRGPDALVHRDDMVLTRD